MKTTRHFRPGLSYFFIIVIHLIHFFMIFAWILLENEKCWQQNARCRKKWIMLDVLPNKIFHINWELLRPFFGNGSLDLSFRIAVDCWSLLVYNKTFLNQLISLFLQSPNRAESSLIDFCNIIHQLSVVTSMIMLSGLWARGFFSQRSWKVYIAAVPLTNQKYGYYFLHKTENLLVFFCNSFITLCWTITVCASASSSWTAEQRYLRVLVRHHSYDVQLYYTPLYSYSWQCSFLSF